MDWGGSWPFEAVIIVASSAGSGRDRRWREGAGSLLGHVFFSLQGNKGHVNKERVSSCLVTATALLVIASVVAGDGCLRTG